MKALIIFASFVLSFSSYASIPQKMEIKSPQLKQDFSVLISKAKDFHKVIQEGGDPEQIREEVAHTKEILNNLYAKIPYMSNMHQRLHAYKALKSIEERISVLESQGVQKQRGKNKVVKKIFNSFFELAEVYDLRSDFKKQIFYCRTDKSTWFQEGKKASNPISPNLKNCGQRLF